MEQNGPASSKRKKPQQLHKVSGLQPQGVSLAFSPSFIEAKWLLFDCLWIRVLGMVGALGVLATSHEEERHLFEKFGQVRAQSRPQYTGWTRRASRKDFFSNSSVLARLAGGRVVRTCKMSLRERLVG
jgi:hypothetical protein